MCLGVVFPHTPGSPCVGGEAIHGRDPETHLRGRGGTGEVGTCETVGEESQEWEISSRTVGSKNSNYDPVRVTPGLSLSPNILQWTSSPVPDTDAGDPYKRLLDRREDSRKGLRRGRDVR